MQIDRGPTMRYFTHRITRYILTLLIFALVLGVATDALACPTCKDGMSDPASQATARGYFYSILFMMAMPFVIIGTFGSAAYFSIRRAREQQSVQADHSDE